MVKFHRLVSFFFFKQKTAYEMRISDWSSDVCSSDLAGPDLRGRQGLADRHVETQLPGRRTHLPQLRGVPHQHRARRAGGDTAHRAGHARQPLPGLGPAEVPVQLREGSEEIGRHTSELQVTNAHIVCRLLLEKKKTTKKIHL